MFFTLKDKNIMYIFTNINNYCIIMLKKAESKGISMINYNILKDNENWLSSEVINYLLYVNEMNHLKNSLLAVDVLNDVIKSTIRDINFIIAENLSQRDNNDLYRSIESNILQLAYGLSLPIEQFSILKINKIFKKVYLRFIDTFDDNDKKIIDFMHVGEIFDEIDLVDCSSIINQFNISILNYDTIPYTKIEANLGKNSIIYSTILEFIPDSLVVSYNDNILYANKAAAELFGVNNSEDLVGKKESDFLEITSYDKALAQQEKDVLYRNGNFPSIEKKHTRKKDEEVIYLETKNALVPYKGKKAILKISRDISERKKIQVLMQKVKEKSLELEKSKEYDKVKTEFFANISHELRTPLNLILGVVQLIEKQEEGKTELTKSSNKIKRYRKILKQNCFRLLRLVNNLIDITKIDAGYINMNIVNFNIVSVVEEITLSVAEYMESKGLKLVFDTNVEEKNMCFDPDKIERIILNLLSNAIKFTQEGDEISVTITDMGSKVQISVRDTGIGIPYDKQKIVFDRFVQVDKSLSRNKEGSGIGLSMVKSFVEMHKGKIYVNSEWRNGSEFIIELPVKGITEKCTCKEIYHDKYSNVEKINIEFADIYCS